MQTLKGEFMDKEIVGADLGPEAHVDLKLVDGNVVVELKYKGVDGFASVQAGLSPKMFLDKLKVMIPGQIDDMIIEALKAAMGV
jgi:hypothetical protein